MEKMNFTKIEATLQKAIEQFQKEDLLRMTTSSKGENVAKTRAHTLLFLKTWNKRLLKAGCPKPLAKRIRDLETNFSEEEWLELDAFKQKLLTEMQSSVEKKDADDEKLIEEEKLRHDKKRFNVPERWLPLD